MQIPHCVFSLIHLQMNGLLLGLYDKSIYMVWKIHEQELFGVGQHQAYPRDFVQPHAAHC